MKDDHRSYIRTFAVAKRKPKKNSGLYRIWPLQYPCSTLPIKLTSQLGAGRWVGSLYNHERMMMKLWIYMYENHICELRSEELNEGWSSQLYMQLLQQKLKSCVYNCDYHPSFNSFSIVILKKIKIVSPFILFSFSFPSLSFTCIRGQRRGHGGWQCQSNLGLFIKVTENKKVKLSLLVKTLA